ncbi:thioesterase family protein [Actimicrobium antarcticum]|uniref:Thioesterase family protein n=1 Tax=Actimicrobium antarcticum TaxID=1051899 RepID=A0ABP7T6Z5_9BURK
MHPDLKPGLTFTWSAIVPDRATVPNLYHDVDFCREMPDVLATGYMVGLMELACLQGIIPYLDWPREQSLGTMVSFNHLAATPPGMTLTMKGEVTGVDGRRISFRVEGWDEQDKITEGTHERVVITPDKFNAKLATKIAAAGSRSQA